MGRIWSHLLCFGQTPHMTAVNCCVIFVKAFLFIREFFHQLADPNCSGFDPRGFKALSPQTVFPGGGPLMGVLTHTQRGQEAYECPKRAVMGEAWPSQAAAGSPSTSPGLSPTLEASFQCHMGHLNVIQSTCFLQRAPYKNPFRCCWGSSE